MGKTLKKYLLFDLDTTALKEEFGPKRYTVAYSMIRQFLENCGFEHKQGSGYLSAEPISLNQIIAIYQAMTEEMPWLDSCSKTMDVGNVRGFYNLKTLSQNLVADNAVDNSQLELADFDRVFPTVGISHDESMSRRYLMFDLDSASLKKEFGPTRYALAYSDLREALENRGFEHRQGSGYLSKAPISKNKLIVLYDSLVEELPWLKARKEAGAHNLHEQKKNFPPGIFGKEVRCASCGKILTKGKTLRKTGYERTLFCPTRKKSPSHCKGAFISEKHLESAILHELKNLADRYSDDRVQIGICQDAQSADLIQEKNRLKTAVELIEKEITAYEQRSRDLYLKRATDGMSIDDFNSALSRIRNDVDKLRLKSKRASSELLHLNESIAAESIRMETILKAADFNRLDKTKVSMLIESVYVHKRDPKSGTQAIDITWKF